MKSRNYVAKHLRSSNKGSGAHKDKTKYNRKSRNATGNWKASSCAATGDWR